MSVQSSFGASGEVVVNIKVDTTEANVDIQKLTVSFQELEQIVLRSLILTRRMGLPDDVSSAINDLQRMVLNTNQLRIAMEALTAATLANPLGLALAGLGIAITAFSYADTLTYDSRG